MNQSDDDIFGRNIDQLDRETPRFNLSEEEDDNEQKTAGKTKTKQNVEKKPPSIASVQPYSRASSQSSAPVMSPHPVKKTMQLSQDIVQHSTPTGQYYNQRYPLSPAKNYPIQPIKNFSANPPPNNLSMPRQMENSPHVHQQISNMPRHVNSEPGMRPPPNHIPRQITGEHPNHIKTPFMNQLLNSQNMINPPQQQVIRTTAPAPPPCYCPDCSHPPPTMPQQVVINSERQRIEDEILLRQRELDSCWQEDEVDCPRDFTAIDRKKEKFYAERADVNFSHPRPEINDQHEKDLHLHNRDIKTSAASTSAYSTSVSHSNQPTLPVSSYGPIMKTKAKAVVSPFPRNVPQKKVNINTIVSQFSYSNDPDTPQDYTSTSCWPHSEMGSRIPSSEMISLSPLCMSGVPSGIQTPVEPGTGQKPIQQEAPLGVPSATSLQHLPGHEKKSVLDKFKGNEQYKRPSNVPPQPDSVKDYTGSRWPQSEMGSRIPSSERITLSPLTMSGVPSAVPSGIQTPAEPNTGVVPLRAQVKRMDPESPISHAQGDRPPVERTTPTELQQNKHEALNQPIDQNDALQDYSQIPQSELTSRVPSMERIRLSPLCQSGIQSGRESPQQLSPEPEPIVNENGVTLRAKKGDKANAKLETIMSRLNIGDNSTASCVPRFDHAEQDSIKVFSRPELSSRMQSYESLNFTPPWSANTSGIVTPCDHSSLYGGAKPLRQQPVIEECEADFGKESVNARSNNDAGAKVVDQIDNPSSSDERKSVPNDLPHPHSSNNSPYPFEAGPKYQSRDGVYNNNQNPQSQHIRKGVKIVEGYNSAPEIKNQARNDTLLPPTPGVAKRRNSWSSVESASSINSHMSTVVNAPTSMHNTAPASPDPDGSEASDSIISEQEVDDDTTEFPDTYSQTGSPVPQSQANSLGGQFPGKQGPQYPFQRWPPKNPMSHNGPTKHLPQHIAPPHGTSHGTSQHGMSEQRPVHLGFRANQRDNDQHNDALQRTSQLQNFISMAKEQFRKEPKHHDYQEHVHNPPHPHTRHLHQPQQYPHYGASQHQHPPPAEHQGQVMFDNYPPAHGYPGQFHPHDHQGYQHGNFPPQHTRHIHEPHHHPREGQRHPNEIQHIPHEVQHLPHDLQHLQHDHPHDHPHRHYSTGDQELMLNHSRQSRMHTIPETSLPQQTLHGHRGPMEVHGDVHNAAPHSYNTNHQHAQHFRHPPNSLGQNHMHDVYENSMNPIHEANHLQQQQQVSSKHYTQQRTYSITSLEPHRASPPHTDALDNISVVSFASMAASHQNIDTKADMMSSLLSMLGTHDPDDMARTLFAMSSSPDSCAAMRQSGCISLLIELLHNEDYEINGINWGARQRAGLALHNIVHSNSGDRRGKREIRVLRLLEIIRTHSEVILSKHDENYRSNRTAQPLREHGPGPAVAAIMKLSFEEEHKNSICELGGLQTVGEILAVDFMVNKECNDPYAIALRKYAGMVLINLTYNDAKNKAVLCTMTSTLKAIIGQLQLTEEEDLIQVFAGIIRNISWRPDENTQRSLQSINAVRALMMCTQKLKTEVCIRAVLSAVWNLSAHNSENKEEICRTPGSLKFLAFALSYRSPSKSIDVAENAGGILRNISSHIAVNSSYRQILREEGCMQTLVSQLRSPSTRVVSNSCGVLWNLSARCVEDQELLWELGAVSVLKTLIHSKHKSISASSAAALRNLLAVKPGSGTDTESHVSFQHHRSNSLPVRSYNQRNDKRNKLIDANARNQEMRRKLAKHRNESAQGELTTRYYDLYHDPPIRSMTENETNEEGCPPTYNEATTGSFSDPSKQMHPVPSQRFNQSDENINFHHSDSQNEQFFFPSHSGNFPAMNQLHKRFDSSSSCSSFSPNDTAGMASRIPLVKPTTDSTESKSEVEEKVVKEDDVKVEEKEDEKKASDNDKTPRSIDMKPYDDCKKSVSKDAVLIYVGTSKLKTKAPSKKEKKSKQTTPKLSLKFKRNPLRKSKDSLMSKDSLLDKSDVEKVNEKTRDEKKENVWIQPVATKQKLLNKSHSSDLAFDKSFSNSSTKKSPFDIYSMSNFPDRVASDQCLSMSDRLFRDGLMNNQNDIYQSLSSCDVSNCKEDKIYPNNHGGAIHTPQLLPRRSNDVSGPGAEKQFYSPQLGNEMHYNRQQNYRHPIQRTYSASNQNMHVTNQNGYLDSATDTEKKTSKSKISGILKNPLRKNSEGASKFLKSKKIEKKSKKKGEE